jgi:hypothetical protein
LQPDAQQALVAVSAAGSGLAVGWLYLLGCRMFDRRAALAAALLLASSPLFWFYGEIALPHSLDAFVVLVAVWLFYRVAAGEPGLLVPGAVWLGLAGGLRPQTQLFLMPLALYAGARAGWRRGFAALVALAAVDLLWFVPLVRLSGGLARYLEVTRDLYLRFNTTTSIVSGGGLFGLQRNALKLSMYTLYAWSAGLPLAVLGLVAAARRRRLRAVVARATDARALVLALWLMPAAAYYQLIHMGQQGLVFVFLPVLCLLSAAALALLPGPHLAWLGAAVGINAALFLAAPTYPLGGDRPKLLTADTLRRHDDFFRTRLAAVRARFDPRSAVVLSSAWRFPQYYLGDYRQLRYGLVARWELGEGESLIRHEIEVSPEQLGVGADAEGYRYLVLFDDALEGFNADRARQEEVELEGGGHLAYLRLRPGETIHLRRDNFGVLPARTPSGGESP